MSHTSRFADLVQEPPIEVFELTRQFNESNNPNKVNLGVGGNVSQRCKQKLAKGPNAVKFFKHTRMIMVNHGYCQLSEL